MGIQIDDHDSLDFRVVRQDEMDGERYIGVGTETTPFVPATVVESTSDVDGPAPLHGQLAGNDASSSLISVQRRGTHQFSTNVSSKTCIYMNDLTITYRCGDE